MTARPSVGAATRVLGVIGDPVAHSRSPAMHNAAFAALGLDWIYVAFPVPRGHGEAAARAIRDLGLAGLNVTMPHKADAARACDELTADAAALQAVNTVVAREDGSLLGASTDGEGFVRALAEEGVVLGPRRRVVVLGAGGAARAIAHAVGTVGGELTVAARRPDEAAAVAALAPAATSVALDTLSVAAFDVVVNATPIGMGGELPPFDVDQLHATQFVFDTVYSVDTLLLQAARARGAGAAGGLGMLVHQGALAFRMFTGQDPPLEVMRAAAAS